ncbi:MmgE/PrpD family protein [Kribbella lupini]|uniref:MmgE/PrpD family protein n=1 Tax=Kribbella lupini TaxID=291602 RepID=A0ABP4NGA1_9ACTN
MTAATVAGPTTDLAGLAAGLDAAALPARVTEVTGHCLTDFIAVAALGGGVDSSAPVLATIGSLSLGGPITVIGRAAGASAEHAALLNGTFAHTLDFDDTNIGAKLHPGAPVIAAALAAAEYGDSTGPDLVAGIVAGYEVTCRIGRALGEGAYDRGFHPTAVAGTFGAAAGAGRVLGASETEIRAALGVAGSMAAGSMQFLGNGSWNKRLHPGLAARNGLLAALLARDGFRGSEQALEGASGALVNYSSEADPAELTRDLGSGWLMLDTGFKPYPSCRLTHTPTDLCLQVRDELGRAPVPGEKITVTISPRADSIVGGGQPQKVRPQNVVDAQFSVRYQCAVALLDGEVNWSSYADLRRPDVIALAERLDVVVDPEQALAAAELRVDRAGETVLRLRRDAPRGESGDPANPAVVETKLRQASTGIWSPQRLERLVRLCQAPSDLPSAREWIPLLAAEAGAGAAR